MLQAFCKREDGAWGVWYRGLGEDSWLVDVSGRGIDTGRSGKKLQLGISDAVLGIERKRDSPDSIQRCVVEAMRSREGVSICQASLLRPKTD
jgi:hypothetical protein